MPNVCSQTSDQRAPIYLRLANFLTRYDPARPAPSIVIVAGSGTLIGGPQSHGIAKADPMAVNDTSTPSDSNVIRFDIGPSHAIRCCASDLQEVRRDGAQAISMGWRRAPAQV